jgi:hypothetical protein
LYISLCLYTYIATNVHSPVETYANAGCAPPANQVQNINSNQCIYLPQLSAKVYFLEKSRANCRRKSLYWNK